MEKVAQFDPGYTYLIGKITKSLFGQEAPHFCHTGLATFKEDADSNTLLCSCGKVMYHIAGEERRVLQDLYNAV